jgi:predicted deacylase
MQAQFALAGLHAEPGSRQSAVLPLSLAGVDIQLPLFIINGAHSGPTVLVTAGVQGAEYGGIETAYRLARQTDLADVHGQLVVVSITSFTAFTHRAIYLCPPDNKNLNRHVDAYIDLHGGDMNEALIPFTIYRRTGNAEVDARHEHRRPPAGRRRRITSRRIITCGGLMWI